MHPFTKFSSFRELQILGPNLPKANEWQYFIKNKHENHNQNHNDICFSSVLKFVFTFSEEIICEL